MSPGIPRPTNLGPGSSSGSRILEFRVPVPVLDPGFSDFESRSRMPTPACKSSKLWKVILLNSRVLKSDRNLNRTWLFCKPVAYFLEFINCSELHVDDETLGNLSLLARLVT